MKKILLKNITGGTGIYGPKQMIEEIHRQIGAYELNGVIFYAINKNN